MNIEELIDDAIAAGQEISNEHEWRESQRVAAQNDYRAARAALVSAFKAVEMERDGYIKMMHSAIFEDMPKEQLILIIHGMQDERAEIFGQKEVLQAQLAEAEADAQDADRVAKLLYDTNCSAKAQVEYELRDARKVSEAMHRLARKAAG